MTGFEWLILGLLGLLVVEQVGAVLIFRFACLRGLTEARDAFSPPALVILAVRGVDASLGECVRALLRQKYSEYYVRVVLDSDDDPARDVVERVCGEVGADHLEIQIIRERRSTCTLKCSAVYEATENLPDRIGVVVTVDSDIVPHETWLRELVAPLANPRVGAAMGNRWYAPLQDQWGSIVCYLWNAAVVVSMYFNRVPWGGSLAMDAAILRSSNLRERWTKAGCEDVPLFAVLFKMGRRLVFVPSVLMSSREECTLAECLRFINRQFVWARLYHPVAWWGGAILYGITMLTLLASLALGLRAPFDGRWVPAAALVASAIGFVVIQALLLVILERLARRLMNGRAEAACRLGLKLFAGIPLSQALTPLMFLRSLFTREIGWRGITYDVRGPWNIHMRQYQPYRAGVAQRERDAAGEVEFPNLLSRLFLKREFNRQFIVPPPPPWPLERFLMWYERKRLRPDVSQIAIRKPIFLIGLHRSGTTLLQDLMCLHPEVGYINNAMPSFRRCFCAAEHFRKRLGLDFRGERMLRDSVEITAGSPNEGVAFWREWLGEDHYRLDFVRRSISNLSPEQIERIRSSIKKVLWCFEGRATRFFFKNPSLMPHLELLNELFPDACFIHIVRDARTCANSMVKLYRLEQAQLERIRKSGGHGIYDNAPYVAFPRLPRLAEYVATYGADSVQTTARLWNDAIDEVNRVKGGLNSFYEVRYEDILKEPDRELARVFEFCELPPIGNDNAAYWNKLATVGTIRHSNQYSDYDLIESICREKLVQYGYLADGERAPAYVAAQAAGGR
jgi:hypothetical protein